MTAEEFGKVIDLFSPSMDDYLYVCDLQRDYYEISANATERFLLPSDHFDNATEAHRGFVYSGDVELLMEELKQLAAGTKHVHNMHYRWLSKEGNPIWINCRGQVLLDAEGKPHFLVGCINEIGKKQKADNVSGLLGESSFRAYYESFEGKTPEGFVLRLGIDDFKDINENQGVQYGDFVLKKTAECITEQIRPGQHLYRIVADEFVVADFQGGTIEDAVQLYKDIQQEIFRFIEENQYKAVYTVSGGILSTGDGTRTFENTLKLSEFALSEAKRSGKNSYYVFEQDSYEAYIRKRELNRALHHAVNHDFEGFEVYFQPLVGAENEGLSGAEALLRFRDKEGRMISPVEFIPILEESGLIIPVGRWVLRQSLDACKEWRRYLPHFKVNVNLSYIQVLKSRVLAEVIELVKEYDLSPSSLCVELTESGYLEESPHFSKVWSGLKNYGVQLALDDFGTGYSNLHCLCDLKPNVVKIDRTFTIKALRQDYEYRLLTHIIEMAHSLGLNVCVEGIENNDEFTKVMGTEPDFIQGYLFGKPCSRGEFFESFLANDSYEQSECMLS